MIIKALVLAVAGLSIAAQFTLPALASTKLLDLQRQMVLRKAEKLSGQDAAANRIVGRAATVRIVGTITKKSKFNTPMRCTIQLLHPTPDTIYGEVGSGPLVFQGAIGTCDVSIPFRWAYAFDGAPIFIGITVGDEDCNCTGNDVGRASLLELPPIEIPDQNSLKFMRFNLDM
jgi:hypothetical protein